MSGKIRAAFAVALAAAGLTGCAGMNGYSVRDESAGQRDVIGDVVHLGATLCLDDEAPSVDAARLALPEQGDGTCDPVDPQVNYAMGFSLNAGVQFFTGFLVPAGAGAPATATAMLPAAFMPRAVTLTRKPSLDETLEATRPAPAGQRWVGYISPVVGAAAVGGEEPSDVRAGLRALAEEPPTPYPAPDGDGTGGDWSAAADFAITRGDGGLPAPASFTHAVLGGVRMAYPDAIYDGVDPLGPYLGPDDHFGLQLLASRPVDCQELRGFPYAQLLGVPLDGTDEDPDGLPLLQTTLCGRASNGADLALKDLRGSGGESSVAPGATATVPFTLRYAGDAGPSFALSATTGVPGATVTPSPTTLTPSGAGFQDATVAVTVPAGTAPGAYAVTLTATVAGQTRTARGTVTVTGAPGTTTGVAAAGDGDDDAPVSATSTPTAPTRVRQLEFRGFDRSGVGPDGKSVNLGDVLCHKTDAGCDWVTVQLTVRWEQLHAGAEIARASARQRVRMVTIGATTLSVPAQGRRRVKVTLPPSVRRMLAGGEILHAVAAVRPARNRVPIVHRIALRRG